MKSKANKQRPAIVLSTFSLVENVLMETRDDGAFGYDEADITMVSYVNQAAKHGVCNSCGQWWHRPVCLTGLLATQSRIAAQGPEGEMEWNSTRNQCNLY